MKLDDPGLENDFVRLVQFDRDHSEWLRGPTAMEAMWRWMPDIPRAKSVDAYVDHLSDLMTNGEMVGFSVFRQRDDAFSGIAAFEEINRVHRRARIICYWVPEDARGTGVFPSIQSLMIRRALDWRARRLEWMLPVEATAGVRAIKKLGAHHEGTLRSYFRLAEGSWADMALFSMMRDEAEDALFQLDNRLRSISEA